MHTIRKGEPRDIAAIAVIYDRILDREERGRASTGWIRGVYPTADTARAALEAGELFVMEREGRVVVAGRSTMSSARSTPPSHGRSRRRRMSRCSCCTRSCPTRSSRGTAAARSSSPSTNNTPASTAAPGSGSTRTRATSPRAACTPASAIVRWTSYRASSTASPMCSLSAWKSASDPPQYPFRRPRPSGAAQPPAGGCFFYLVYLWILVDMFFV